MENPPIQPYASLPFTIERFGKPLVLYVVREQYAHGGRMAVQLYDEEGEDYATVSINVEGVPLMEDEFIFKTYSENEGLLEGMLGAGMVKLAGRACDLGPICRLNVQKLWPDGCVPVVGATPEPRDLPEWVKKGDFQFPGKWN